VSEPNQHRVALYTSRAVEIMEREAGGLSRRPHGTSPKARRLRLIEFARTSQVRPTDRPDEARVAARLKDG
jgi:hypothetical protein